MNICAPLETASRKCFQKTPACGSVVAMQADDHLPSHRCPGITRRSFLADTGMGFTGLALGAMLFGDGVARADSASPAWRPPDGRPHFPAKAKSVIWIFLCGGVSHVESFDVKPELNKYAGKSIEETPYKDVLDPKRV